MGGCVLYTEFMIYLFLCNFFLHFSLSLIFRLQITIFVSFFSVPLKATQRAHDVYTTSARRRCNVMTLHRRWADVVLTSCACWVESWNLIHTVTLDGYIVYTQIMLLLLIHSFIIYPAYEVCPGYIVFVFLFVCSSVFIHFVCLFIRLSVHLLVNICVKVLW